eukprot:TRINITY_DN12278_c0_g7_i1.p1 TRINITY_DN12278_c0_g7~~TRINITY_DN12278_c0_g7_i1.p1  ORF type:complete len:442 (+),score=49.25 TRINITY_DN12278_c0_g7_i1:132-1328(+)
MDFPWYLYAVSLSLFSDLSLEILKDTEELLATYGNTLRLLSDGAECLLGKIWNLHYFVKLGLISGRSATQVSHAALLLLNLVSTCQQLDARFLDDLWRFARLTPPLIQYTVWLHAPTQLWPAFLQGGSLVDIGASTGLDTEFYAFYGRSFGSHSVVAVEGSKWHARHIGSKMRESKTSNVRVLNRVIQPQSEADKFGDSTKGSWKVLMTKSRIFSPLRSAPRGLQGEVVNASTCRSILEHAPAPVWYVKIDIEEFSLDCLHSLCSLPQDARPRYISVENQILFFPEADTVGILRDCGYNKFKLVRQEPFQFLTPVNGSCHDQECISLLTGSSRNIRKLVAREAGSGPFGEDATDWRTGLSWRTAGEVNFDLKILQYSGGFIEAANIFDGDLMDIHAAL